MVKKTNQLETILEKKVGRPKNKWTDEIPKNMEVLKVKNWKDSTGNRKEWNKFVEKAKTHP
jgi:hypothetical protein